MRLQTTIPRLLALFAIGFAAVLVQLGYWKFARADALASHPRNARFQASLRAVQRGRIVTAEGVPIAVSREVDKDPRGLRSSRFEREYAGGDVFAHVVGYSSFRRGATAIEQVLDRWLSGRGEPRVPRDLWDLLDPPPVVGSDVHLTLRADLQRLACRELGSRKGAVVALDCRTGAVLALADWPRYDPNALDQVWDDLRAPGGPLLARAYQGLYPPGSVFKVITAAGALDAAVVDPDTAFVSEGVHRYPHSTVKDREALGRLTLTTAISRSSNIALAEVALRLGPRRFEDLLLRQGLNAAPDLFAPGDDSLGLVPRGKFPRGDALTEAQLAACGYGQGALAVSPLQVAGIGQMLGNGGVRLEPHLVERIVRPDGHESYRHRPGVGQPVVARSAASSVLQMMRKTMEPGGTASFLRVRGLSIAGKTGSAQNPAGRAHSWFMAIAPVDRPQVAVAVVVENAGAGGTTAGPIAIAVLRAALGR